MKYLTGMLTATLLIAAFVLSACEDSSDKMERAETSVIEAERDLEIAKSEMEAELRIYRANNESRLVEYNRSIEEIKRDISNETDTEVRARHQTRLDRYQATHRELKRELDNYNVSGRDNWDNFKSNFDKRMDDLGSSLNNFFTTSNRNTSTNQP